MKLYVAASKGVMKIGVTKDVKARLSSLQCGNPDTVRLMYAIDLDGLPEVSVRRLEKALHDRYMDSHVSGE